MPDNPALAVVIVSYNSAPTIDATLKALMPQLRTGDEVVIIDNASRDGSASVAARAAPSVRVLTQDRNLGFAGGCIAGAEATSAPLVLFLNPDAEPALECVETLRSVAESHPHWGAWQGLVTLPGGQLVNSCGGITHFLGFGWAGGWGTPVGGAAEPEEASFASGAAMVVRREAWDAVGGFDERYFMYGEDLDLSLRLWLAGWRVAVVPSARIEHAYAFDKGARKWFLLERNRWWTVLGAYPAALLALLAPALLVFELVLLAVAGRGGWLIPKLRAQGAVLAELPAILRRRRHVQSTRRISAYDFAMRLTDSLDNPYLEEAGRLSTLVGLQTLYWRAVRHCLLTVPSPYTALPPATARS